MYKNTEPDIIHVKPFIKINLFGIFLFSINDIFINPNDVENIKTEPNKQEDKTILLYILFYIE